MLERQMIRLPMRLLKTNRFIPSSMIRVVVPTSNQAAKFRVPNPSSISKASFNTQPPNTPEVTFTGHDISLTDEIIYNAVASGSTSLVRALLKAGMDANVEMDHQGPPLSVAVYRGDFPMVQLLLEHHANPNGYEFMGPHTFVGRAAKHSSQDILLALLKHGGGIENDALFSAAEEGNIPAAQVLLDNGADINGQMNLAIYSDEELLRGTALHAAVERGHTKMVRFLLSNGARTDMVDWHSKTALALAEEHGQKEIAELLVDKKE